MRQGRGPWTVVLPVVVLGMSTAGCTLTAAHTESCVSWAHFDTPADALGDATVAVRTLGPAPAVATTDLFGADATVHSVPVAEVLNGSDVAPGSEVTTGQDLEVISTPTTCTAGGTYPDGDPLDAAGSLVLFLHWDDAAQAWRTLTPIHGVVEANGPDAVPLTWPTP